MTDAHGTKRLITRRQSVTITKPLALALAAIAVLGSAFVGVSSAEAAPQVYNPCQRLSAGQVKYSSFGASRVTFATAATRESNVVTITGCVRSGNGYVQEWQDWGYAGLKGFAPPGLTWEDTFKSPTGSYSVTEALGRSNPGTALAYHTVNPNSRWGGEHGPTYNQYFEGGGGPSDENLYTYMNQGYYEQAAVINYNRQPDMPVTQGASYAIFLHAGRTTSAGCISTSLGVVNQFLRTNRPGDRIIMGAVDDIFSPFSANPWGAISEKYTTTGGPAGGLGSPTSNETGGLKDGGAFQNFQGGAILWSPSTGARISVGSIRGLYAATGYENGVLGYPTSDEVGGLRDGGVYQNYEGGAVLWSPATGAHISTGPIRDKYGSVGFEGGRLGYPNSDVVYGLKEGGAYQNYQGGAIIWTPANGARLSVGTLRDAWASTGFEHGTLGFPTTDEFAIPGGVAQNYQGGVITASAAGTFVVNGAIFQKHDQMGRTLGFAVSPQVGIRDGGVYQNFQHGAIVWSPATGAHVSAGGTRGAWGLSGFENGVLGYPTTDEIPVNGGVKQSYQGGAIYWTESLGAYSVATDYNAKFEASGGLGTLGFPDSNLVTGLKDGGSYQNFQKGALISSPATGIHLSIGATRNAWAATGFESGKLGYPTTDNYVAADGSTVQDYQGGRITIEKDGTATVEYGVSRSQ
jgi:uncharacterized protein with LGFP repeats/L,D-peptidoglycan transpeptidase YkuD (ErfK/YbiS/YcfS/YnhG family)